MAIFAKKKLKVCSGTYFSDLRKKN